MSNLCKQTTSTADDKLKKKEKKESETNPTSQNVSSGAHPPVGPVEDRTILRARVRSEQGHNRLQWEKVGLQRYQ